MCLQSGRVSTPDTWWVSGREACSYAYCGYVSCAVLLLYAYALYRVCGLQLVILNRLKHSNVKDEQPTHLSHSFRQDKPSPHLPKMWLSPPHLMPGPWRHKYTSKLIFVGIKGGVFNPIVTGSRQ